jgi:hypothetical protein
MRKLGFAVVAVLFMSLFIIGCFGDEAAEECAGDQCIEEQVTLNEEKNVEDPVENPVVEDPTEEPVVEQEPEYGVPKTTPETNYDYGLGADDAVLPVPGEETPVEVPAEGITIDDLTPDELATIDTFRTTIDFGLDVGRFHYLEEISLSLQMMGIHPDYESVVEDQGFAGLEQPPEQCPFAKYYDNGFEPSGFACDYLADIAKVQVYSELTNILGQYQLPTEIMLSPDFAEAEFWYEQGAVSGLEEERVKVRFDLGQKACCDVEPTPKESSYTKGVLVGRQLFALEFNKWLTANGYVADYPTMSSPIQVCNANVSMLNPAKSKAVQKVEVQAKQVPLCDNYVPPNQEAMLQFGQAGIDYEKGIKKGVDDEFALASVKVFKVIPCNVSDPIVLDLDGDGLELLPIHQGVNFDLYGTGSQAIAWVAPDDGLLALDANNNGIVDNGLELFGNVQQDFSDGYAHLRTLDTNGDGMLNMLDPAFELLMVWRDVNSNARTDAGEMVPLASLGIHSMSLNAQQTSLVSSGSRIPLVSEAMGNGFTMTVGDAFLKSAPWPRL